MKKVIVTMLFFFFMASFLRLTQGVGVPLQINVYSKEEYDRVVAELDLPDYMIYYEDIAFLGEFRSCARVAPREGSPDVIEYTVFYGEEEHVPVGFRVLGYDHFFYKGSRMTSFPSKNVSFNEDAVVEGALGSKKYYLMGEFLLAYSQVDGSLYSVSWLNKERGLLYELQNLPSKIPVEGFYADLFNAETFEKTAMLLYDLTVHGKKVDPTIYGDQTSSSGFSTNSVSGNPAVTDLPTDEGMVDVSTETAPLTEAPPTDGTVDAPSTDGNASDAPLIDGTDAETANTPADPAPFPWVWVIVPAGVVLISAAATTALVINKKKKQ
ncbi:MAG: hypothetical protein J6M34_08350 [Clostridia bacterium]|nr:hypothetical protein [Clostridia bacterium]